MKKAGEGRFVKIPGGGKKICGLPGSWLRLRLVALALLALIPASAGASGTLTTRGIGMGTAQVAVARGLDAVGVNPANLGMPGGGSFGFRIFDVGMIVHNSTVSLGFYNRYNGDSLDSGEKNDILDRIPDDGLRLDGQGDFQFVGLRIGGFALSLSASASLAAALPKDLFRIVLQGIDFGKTYDFSPKGSGVAYAKLGLSYGRSVPLSYFDEFAVGATVNYVGGIGYAEITRSTGRVRIDYQSEVQSELVARSGYGGSGFSLDAGVAGRTGNIRFGAAFLSLISSIRWQQQTQEAVLKFVGDSVNVYSIADLGPDKLFDKEDSTYDVGAFSSSLPVELVLGVSTTWHGFLLAADYHQSFSNRFGNSTTPELAFGLERRFIPFFPLRAGFALGGGRGFRPSFGFGLHLAAFKWDFALGGVGGFFPPQQRGVYLGTSMRVAF